MYIQIIQMLASNIWPPNVYTIKRAPLPSAAMDFVLSRQDTSMTGLNWVQSTLHLSTEEGGYKLDLSTKMGARKYVGYLQHLWQKVSCQLEIVHTVHKTKILFCYTVKRGFRFSRPQPLTFFTVYPLVQKRG
jgi:hypothetical protein